MKKNEADHDGFGCDVQTLCTVVARKEGMVMSGL